MHQYIYIYVYVYITNLLSKKKTAPTSLVTTLTPKIRLPKFGHFAPSSPQYWRMKRSLPDRRPKSLTKFPQDLFATKNIFNYNYNPEN